METSDKVRICKVVAQAILADGRLTDSEHELLTSLMDKYELDADARKDVMGRNIDDDPAALAKGLVDPGSKNELIVELAMAVAADGELSPAEHDLIHDVAKAIDLDVDEADMLVKNALM